MLKFMLSLLPKLRDQFAEFLKYGSLKAFSLLDLFTSVGLQYGDFFTKTEILRTKIF